MSLKITVDTTARTWAKMTRQQPLHWLGVCRDQPWPKPRRGVKGREWRPRRLEKGALIHLFFWKCAIRVAIALSILHGAVVLIDLFISPGYGHTIWWSANTAAEEWPYRLVCAFNLLLTVPCVLLWVLSVENAAVLAKDVVDDVTRYVLSRVHTQLRFQ